MTSPEVWRDAVVKQRYRGPERRSQPRETPADFIRALAVAALLFCAGYALLLVMAGYFPVTR